MAKNELRKLSRKELLEMLLQQTQEVERLQKELDIAKAAAENREINIDVAGSIAVAALRINGVFEAAQLAAEQYLMNIRRLSERQSTICSAREQESATRSEQLLAEAKARCEAMEAETIEKCNKMLKEAEASSQSYWAEVSKRMEGFYSGGEVFRPYVPKESDV